MRCLFNQNMRIHYFFHDYERLQKLMIILIYIQIGCSFIGSLGALYNGVPIINLGISLFALIAIASDMESLIRTYAVLLSTAVLLDISWFKFFFNTIWNMSSSEGDGKLFLLSVRLTLAMEIVGLCIRFFSSLLLIQLFRLGLGVSTVGKDSGADSRRLSDDEFRASLLNVPNFLDRPVTDESSSGTQDSEIQPA